MDIKITYCGLLVALIIAASVATIKLEPEVPYGPVVTKTKHQLEWEQQQRIKRFECDEHAIPLGEPCNNYWNNKASE